MIIRWMKSLIIGWWLEFLYIQEMQPDSLYHFLDSLRRWWAYRPRIIHCTFCKVPMWWNGEREEERYCCSECAYMESLYEESEELPF